MILRRISDPVGPAVPVQALQEHLRVSTDTDLLHIQGLLSAATGWVEQYLRRSLISQGWELTLDRWPNLKNVDWGDDRRAQAGWIELPRAPVISVSEVRYVDMGGTSTVLAPAAYQLDNASAPARLAPVFGTAWPAARNQIAAIAVTYQAGYGASWNDVPEAVRHAIMMMAATWYEHRENVVVGTIATELPSGVKIILEPYRLWGHV